MLGLDVKAMNQHHRHPPATPSLPVGKWKFKLSKKGDRSAVFMY